MMLIANLNLRLKFATLSTLLDNGLVVVTELGTGQLILQCAYLQRCHRYPPKNSNVGWRWKTVYLFSSSLRTDRILPENNIYDVTLSI